MVRNIWELEEIYPPPILTDEKIAEAEALLGVKLPQSYLDLLRIQNGGNVAYNYFALPNPPGRYGRTFVDVISIAGIGTGQYEDLLNPNYRVVGWERGETLVTLEFDGHFLTALDYSKCGVQGEPSVVWFDGDHVGDEGEEEIQLALNFEEFLAGLSDVIPS
jgi:hypothetical protein